jgi:AcrR family transcriptional regulator
VARVAGRTFSRDAVARAAWRVIRRDGLQGATLRAVAAELGATLRVVTYYFRDKEDLTLFGGTRFSERLIASIDEHVAPKRGRRRLVTLLDTMVPLEESSEVGWRIWLAYLEAAAQNERLRRSMQSRLNEIRGRVRQELKALAAAGELRDGLDLVAETDILMALTDGLGVSHVAQPDRYAPARQQRLIRTHLAKLFRPKRVLKGRTTR